MTASGRVRDHTGARRKRRNAGLPQRPPLVQGLPGHGGPPDRNPSGPRADVHRLLMRFHPIQLPLAL